MELVIRALSKQYPHKLAVDRVSLTLTPGIYGLLGANGAGKTTLMRMLCGILHPTGGEISLDGLGVAQEEYRACLGYLPQDFGLFNELTVAQFLDYMAALKGLRDSGTAVREVIRTVNLEGQARARIRSLSGGQRQRTAAARAIITDPALVLADEPTGALDSRSAKLLLDRFEALNREGRATILMVTHDAFTASYCRRILFLQDGAVLTQLERGGQSRRAFFQQIIGVVTRLGGDQSDVL